MRVGYHPKVQKDVNNILRYYDGVSHNLADEFWNELCQHIEQIGKNPELSHPAKEGLRRVNLRRFPYHILFRRLPNSIRVIVVRHHKRHPQTGMTRL